MLLPAQRHTSDPLAKAYPAGLGEEWDKAEQQRRPPCPSLCRLIHCHHQEQSQQALEAFLEDVSVLGIDEEICQLFGKERGWLGITARISLTEPVAMLARSPDLAVLFSPAFGRENPCGIVMENGLISCVVRVKSAVD